MKTSESIKNIASALLKAQEAIQTVVKDKTGKVLTKSGREYEYNYSDLSSVIAEVKKPLNDNGIVFVQAPSADSSGVLVTTTLLHVSGEWLAETLYLPVPAGATSQAYGSAITYGKRYGLQSLTGLPSEDDDGKKAGEAPGKAPNASSAAADKIIAANKERPSHPTQLLADALAAMDVEEQNRMRDIAVQITDAFGENDGAAARATLLSYGLDHDQQLAVGGLLASKIRTAIKNARTNGELATQP